MLYVDGVCNDTAARTLVQRRFHETTNAHPPPLGTVLLALSLLASGAPASAQDDRTLRLEAIETLPDDPGLAAALAELIDLQPGDEIEAVDLLAARREIARAGWYDRVEIYTRAGSKRGQLVLRVEGELDKGLNFETGVGHDPLDGWYLNLVGVSVRHLVGPASTVRANVQFGQRSTMNRFEVEAPRVGGQPLDLLFDAASGVQFWNEYTGDVLFTREIDHSYYRFGVRGHLNRATALAFWAGGSKSRPGGFDDEQRFTDLRLDLTLDRRDRLQPWRRGAWTLLRGGVSIPDDDRPAFANARAAFRGAIPLPQQQALALRIDAAWTDRGTPFFRRPIFGGLGSVRGFRDASLSGADGARAMFAAGLEWRVPLLPRRSDDARVHGILFADTGRAVDATGATGPWSSSVGWGVRVRLPWIEYVGLEVGIPLTPTATDDEFWVHGSLGFGF